MNSKERRQGARLAYDRPVRYQVRGEPEFNSTRCNDISREGLSFLNNKFIAPNKMLMLEFSVLNRAIHPIATVTWAMPINSSDTYKIGVKFVEFDAGEKNFFWDFMELQENRFGNNS